MRVEINHLKKSYNGHVVLDIDRLSVPDHKITAIVGPNGAGKSTLLNMIADLLEKDSGEILYDGDEKIPNKAVTLVFQEPYLISTTVEENILYPMKLRKMDKGVMKERLDFLSKELSLTPLLNKKSHQLSLGETQKAAFARALSFEPELLLLDEPSASIDPYTTNEIEKLLLKLNREKGTTMCIITHNLVQAKRLADHVVLLNKGKVVESCPADRFFHSPERPETKKFIEGELLI